MASLEPFHTDRVSPPAVTPMDSEIGLTTYLGAVLRRWKWLLAVALVGGLVFALPSLLASPVYEATASIIAIPSNGSAASVAASGVRALLENNRIAIDLVHEFELDRLYGLSPERFRQEHVTVEEVRPTTILRLRVRLLDPKMAAAVANAFSLKAVNAAQRVQVAEIGSLKQTLSGDLQQAAQDLSAAEKRLLDFQRTASLDVERRQTDALLSKRSDLVDLVIDIEGERARLAKSEEQLAHVDKVIPVPRQPQAEAALSTVGPGRTPGDAGGGIPNMSNPYVNPVYEMLEYQITLSRARLAQLDKQRQAISSQLHLGAPEWKELTAVYAKEIELKRRELEYDLAQKSYAAIKTRYDQAQIEVTSVSARVEVVDPAVPPERPLARGRVLSALLGFTVTLLVASVAVVLWQQLRAIAR